MRSGFRKSTLHAVCSDENLLYFKELARAWRGVKVETEAYMITYGS